MNHGYFSLAVRRSSGTPGPSLLRRAGRPDRALKGDLASREKVTLKVVLFDKLWPVVTKDLIKGFLVDMISI